LRYLKNLGHPKLRIDQGVSFKRKHVETPIPLEHKTTPKHYDRNNEQKSSTNQLHISLRQMAYQFHLRISIALKERLAGGSGKANGWHGAKH